MAEISYLSAWTTVQSGIYPAASPGYYATISGASFTPNTDYLILFGISYASSDPTYFIDCKLDLPDGSNIRTTLGTDTAQRYKSFSGALLVNSGASPATTQFQVAILTYQPTGSVNINNAVIIAIDMTTGLRVGRDVLRGTRWHQQSARNDVYTDNDLLSASLPATSVATDWLVLGTTMAESTLSTDFNRFGLRLYNSTDAAVLQTREESKGNSITNSGLGTDRMTLGCMAILEGNTAAKNIKIQCVGNSDWSPSYSQLIFLNLNRLKYKIIDQGNHAGASISGLYNIVPMDGGSLSAIGSQGQIYLWAAALSASAGSGADLQTRDGISTVLSLGGGGLYSPRVWNGQNVFWVMQPCRETSVGTFSPNTQAEQVLGVVSAYGYMGVAFNTTLNPIEMDPVYLDMLVAEIQEITSDIDILVAQTLETASDLDVLIAEIHTIATSLSVLISSTLELASNIDIAVAASHTRISNLDIHLSGVEYLIARLGVLIAEPYEIAPVDLDMAVAEPYTLSVDLDIVITDAPSMILEPDRPTYPNDIIVLDFQTTANPNSWYSPSLDFASLGVAPRDVIKIDSVINAGYYVVREVQGHTLVANQLVRAGETGPVPGAIRRERDITAHLNAAAVLNQPMFVAGKSAYCVLDMLIQ